jgi:molybdate transport system substrate-binding protein
MRRTGVLAALLPLALVTVACGDTDEPEGSGSSTTAAEERSTLEGELVVLAATSLQEAFDEVEAAFEAAHPAVDVQVTTDGSANLATAIIEGAPGDVFASADAANLRKVVDEGLAGGSGTTFVTNLLQIVVEEGNPLGIDGLEDLSDPGVTLSLCQEEVPCGRYAVQAFEAAGLPVPPAGQEDKVSGVLTKVMLGEADAGLVYVTDVLAAGGVEGVDLAEDEQVMATYPASVLTEAQNPEAAAAFVEFLTGEEAQAILTRFGFGSP